MPVTVNEVIRRLSQGFNQVFDDYKGLYLFGISSDGEIHEDEDIELAAIFDIDDQSKRKQIWPIIGKVETEMDVCIDFCGSVCGGIMFMIIYYIYNEGFVR